MASLVRPSIGLTVAPAEQVMAGGRVNTSYYGGLPTLPDGMDWPVYGPAPMVLLAQLDCTALAPTIRPEWTLPADGVLLFFHDDTFTSELSRDGTGDDGCLVLHVPAGAPVRPAPPDTPVIPALPLSAAPAASTPPMRLPALDELFMSNPPLALDVLNEFKAELAPAPTHRMLGWSEDDFFDLAGYRPVLQLEAEDGTAWGECVNISFWVPEADLAVGRLDRARRVLEIA